MKPSDMTALMALIPFYILFIVGMACVIIKIIKENFKR